MKQETILVTGARGQIGTALTAKLRQCYGSDQVIATDLRPSSLGDRYETLDVTNASRLLDLVRQYRPTQIYHLAAILSARGESMPLVAWNINMNGTLNVLEIAREQGVRQVYCPSSIAVFGNQTPLQHTPQHTVLNPSTVYGITKVAGELLGEYYFKRYGLDVRGIRYPGVISYETPPGGGTTDYAVDIFYKAVAGEAFTCFLRADTRLPMMYMPDVLRATLQLMDAPADRITVHGGYNLAAFSFTPAELADTIRALLPNFRISYQIDPLRQAIADSWSDTIDDSQAVRDWGWQPAYTLSAMAEDMIAQLQQRMATAS